MYIHLCKGDETLEQALEYINEHDSEGRKYDEGDKIPDECRIATCMDGGWAQDEVECSPCGAEIGTKMEWTCADGVTKVDWCECVEDEESGSKWNCVERVDLNCPNE